MTRTTATDGENDCPSGEAMANSARQPWKARDSGPLEVELLDRNEEAEIFADEIHPRSPLQDRDSCSNDEYQLVTVVPVVTFADAFRGHASWRTAMDHFLFPPNLPQDCQLLRMENMAIPACYLLVGLLQGFSSVMAGVFPLDLGATEAQQTTLRSLRSLPSAFKLFFGFLSDNVPIGGYRRKPYMVAGWLLCSASQLALLFFSNLRLTSSAGCFAQDFVDPTVPMDAPSVPFLAASLFLFGCGFWLADVMADSMVAVKAKREPPYCRGSVQSSCYSWRFFGLMVAAPMATYLYSATTSGPLVIVCIMALLPLAILPLIFFLAEDRQNGVPSTQQQCTTLWHTVCQRAVWQPLGAIFVYNTLQMGNAAWREFQRTVLRFTSCQINLLALVGHVLLYAGILTYKYGLMHYSWRNIYILTILANGLLSILQVMLIYGVTLGLSSFWFALGDDVFVDFVEGIQFLPNTIMMVHLCPTGSEGASYAMFTTNHNAALHLSATLSTLLLGIWDVSKAALAAGNITGMANLAYLTTGLQLSGILLTFWLPHTKQDLLQLTKEHSAVGGFLFLVVTLLSIAYTVFVSLMNILAPGWSGES